MKTNDDSILWVLSHASRGTLSRSDLRREYPRGQFEEMENALSRAIGTDLLRVTNTNIISKEGRYDFRYALTSKGRHELQTMQADGTQKDLFGENQ